MSINLSCPISGEQRDQTVVRIVAGLVFGISLLSLLLSFTQNVLLSGIILSLLAFDFLVRAFMKPKYSILAFLGRIIARSFGFQVRMVDAAAKIFAARIGVLFSASSALLFLFQQQTAGQVVLFILIFCAGLEFIVEFCLGCYVYGLLPRKIGNLLSKSF